MSPVAELVRTQVDLGGLMRVLANNMYSTPEVVVRELVQNAHDSCTRRRLEDTSAPEGRILVVPDAAAGTLSIVDNGAGLTREEIDRYLATVGAGYTGRLRAAGADAGLIGQFGIGFLSAYVVSTRVDLYTTSFQTPQEGWHFSSAGGERYTVAPHAAQEVGTRVVLQLSERFRPLCDAPALEALLRRYCCLLPMAIHVSGPERPAINRPPPPWRDTEAHSPLRRRSLERAFAARFEQRFEPLCTLPMAPGNGGSASGLLWLQDGATFGTSDNRNLSIFVRGMLVSRDARELLPEWAGFVGGVLEADALTPTASREDVQRDAAFDVTAEQVRECLIDGLSRLAREDEPTWRRLLQRHNEALLGAALCDERLFTLLADALKVPTTEGDLTLPAVRRRSGGRLHASTGESGGPEEVLCRALGVPVVDSGRYAALPFTRRWAERQGLPVLQLGTREGNAALFPRVQLEPAQEERLRALFAEDGVELVPSRFSPPALPLVLVPDREAELKARLEADAADKRIGAAVLSLARGFTATISSRAQARLYLNVDAPTLQALLAAPEDRARSAARLLSGLCTLLSHRDERAGAPSVASALEGISAALCALLPPSA
ncbi:ATP-binding protein [Archangium violaceum]|uniref:ATP-binding protein n=1 Tax=Archangium violaceum TaxID=83451 RepID=UPI0036DC8398